MSTKAWAVFTILFTTLLTSTAQILWKVGSKNLTFNLLDLLKNYYVIGGILIYVVAGILLIISLRGGEVSVLYPIIATSFIWVSLLSVKFLNEAMNMYRWIGVTLIIFGIVMIGFGSRDAAPGVA